MPLPQDFRDVMTDRTSIFRAKLSAFMIAFIRQIILFRYPQVNHVGVSVALMNLVRPPRTMANELGEHWMRSANETYGNWFSVTEYPYGWSHGTRI